MKKSSELFMEMREMEALQLTATKKSIIEKGNEYSKNIIENGLISKQEAFAKVIRNATFWETIKDNLKNNLTEKETFYGVEVTPVNGRLMVQYSEDNIYCELLKDLKDREELLKLAQKQNVFDAYGNEVPKVSVKYSKDSINIKF